ncbi:hypothetical protein Tco_0814431 [Tanacetum coccineum]
MDEGRWGTAVKTSTGPRGGFKSKGRTVVMVVKYYEDHPLAGAGMMLWGDLQVLFESHEGGHGSLVWSDQQQWALGLGFISFSSILCRDDEDELEIEIDGVGNDMTYAEQLIQFIKNQIAASIPSA